MAIASAHRRRTLGGCRRGHEPPAGDNWRAHPATRADRRGRRPAVPAPQGPEGDADRLVVHADLTTTDPSRAGMAGAASPASTRRSAERAGRPRSDAAWAATQV